MNRVFTVIKLSFILAMWKEDLYIGRPSSNLSDTGLSGNQSPTKIVWIPQKRFLIAINLRCNFVKQLQETSACHRALVPRDTFCLQRAIPYDRVIARLFDNRIDRSLGGVYYNKRMDCYCKIIVTFEDLTCYSSRVDNLNVFSFNSTYF